MTTAPAQSDYCSYDAHLASSTYNDGHGICDHSWRANEVGWDVTVENG